VDISPLLSLVYSTHGGSGIAGVGWSLGLAKLERRIDEGIPSFDDSRDTFALQGAGSVCSTRTSPWASNATAKLNVAPVVLLTPVAMTRAFGSAAGAPTAPSCGCAGNNSTTPDGRAGLRSKVWMGAVGVIRWKSPFRPEW